MKKNLIGVGTSISREKDYDPFDTLQFCTENNLGFVQIYLDNRLIASTERIKRIVRIAKEKSIVLTCHSPLPLCNDLMSDDFLAAVKSLLCNEKKKKLIIHYNESLSLNDSLLLLKELGKQGLCPCVENYHKDYKKQAVLENIRSFNSLISHASTHDLSFCTVFDIPRLFISAIIKNIDPLMVTKQILDNCSSHSIDIILHLIDFADYSQERDSWLPVGKGLMPYKKIFKFAEKSGVSFDMCVLEYEDKRNVIESLPEVLKIK